jgi:hypothetical protein
MLTDYFIAVFANTKLEAMPETEFILCFWMTREP